MSGVSISKTKISMAVLLYIEEIANKNENTRVRNSKLDKSTGLIESVCLNTVENNNLDLYLDEVIKGLRKEGIIDIKDEEEFKTYITRRFIFETSTQLKESFTGTSYFYRYGQRFTRKVNNSNRSSSQLSEDDCLRILSNYVMEHTDNIKFSSNMLSEIDQSLVMMNRSSDLNSARFSSNRTESQREAMKSSVAVDEDNVSPIVIPYNVLEDLVAFSKVSRAGKDDAKYTINDFIKDIEIDEIDKDFAEKSSTIKFTRNIDYKYAKDYWDRQLKSYTSAIKSQYGYIDKAESYSDILDNIKSDGSSGCNDKSVREIGNRDSNTQDIRLTLMIRGYRAISTIIKTMKSHDEPFDINFDELVRVGLNAFPPGEDIELDKVSELLDVHERVIQESRRQSNIDEAKQFREIIGDNLFVDTTLSRWFKNLNSNELIMECQNSVGRKEKSKIIREVGVHKSYINIHRQNRVETGQTYNLTSKDPLTYLLEENSDNKLLLTLNSDLADREAVRNLRATKLKKERSNITRKVLDSKDGITMPELNSCEMEQATDYNLVNAIINLSNKSLASITNEECMSPDLDIDGNPILRGGRPNMHYDKDKIKKYLLENCKPDIIPLMNFKYGNLNNPNVQRAIGSFVPIFDNFPLPISISNISKLDSLIKELGTSLREMDVMLGNLAGLEQVQIGKENGDNKYNPIKLLKSERLLIKSPTDGYRHYETLAIDRNTRRSLNVSAMIILRDELKMRTELEYNTELGNKVLYPFEFLKGKFNIPEHLRDIYEEEYKGIIEIHDASLFREKLIEILGGMFEGENLKCKTKTPNLHSEDVFKLLYSTHPLEMYINKYILYNIAVSAKEYMLDFIAELTIIFLRIREDHINNNIDLNINDWLTFPKFKSKEAIKIKSDLMSLAKRAKEFPEKITNLIELSDFGINNKFYSIDTENIVYFGEDGYIKAVDDLIEGKSERMDFYRSLLQSDNITDEERFLLKEIVSCEGGIPFNKLNALTSPIFGLEEGHIEVLKRIYRIVENLITIKEIVRGGDKDSILYEDIDYNLSRYDIITVKSLNQLIGNRIRKFSNFNYKIYSTTNVSALYRRVYKTTKEFNSAVRRLKELANYVEPEVGMPYYRGIDESVNDYIGIYYSANEFRAVEDLENEMPDEKVQMFISKHSGYRIHDQMNYVIDKNENPVYIRYNNRNWVIYKTGKIITERLAEFNTYESQSDIWHLDITSTQFLEKHREEFMNWHMG